MNRKVIALLMLVLILPGIASSVAVTDTTIIATSFEQSDAPPYALGSVNGQNLWSVANGSGIVSGDSVYAWTGMRGLQISCTNSALRVQHQPYAGDVQGVTGIVYVDLYVKILASTGKEFTINGNDLYSGSRKRTFVVDFTVPANDTGSVRIYNGSSKVTIASYRTGTWNRVIVRVDYAASTYQVSINGAEPVAVAFRESYTPTASGTRPANIKEYHQLLLNLGTDTNSGSLDAAIDRLYVGTTPPDSVFFEPVIPRYAVNVNQPSVGSISLAPSGGVYDSGTVVTATLHLPLGYRNAGWTGDLAGTDTLVSFAIAKDITIGATIAVDTTNPPPLCRLTIVQPQHGLISVTPVDSSFYAYTAVTASITVDSGYRFVNWTGVLSGSTTPRTFSITTDTVLGAAVNVIPSGSRKIFTSASSLKTAMQNAVPGDTLELADGTYTLSGTFTMTGTEAFPIRVKASNRGRAILSGSSSLTFRFSSYVILEGFVFTGDVNTAVKTESSHHLRITRNVFRLVSSSSSSKWIVIGGYYLSSEPNSYENRIDHNLFEEKHDLGNFITIDGSPDSYPPARSSQRDRIDHNHFRNIGPRAVNEMESIRLGWSAMSMSSGFTTVEYNLFEQCDGDPEIISVKTCHDTIRANTFRRSKGTVCLRHGNGSVVEGNFFFGGGIDSTGGVRVYADSHRVVNNYFEGLTGTRWDAPITVTNGDVDYPSTSLTSHFRPRFLFIAHNTLVNNTHNIEIGYTGSGYNKPPSDILFLNNIVVGSDNPLVSVVTTPVRWTWAGNIMHPTGSATLGITASEPEIRLMDPLLAQREGVWRLSEGSPARDAASAGASSVLVDIDGQARSGQWDIGADEFSDAPKTSRPLTSADVGPDAPEELVMTSVPGAAGEAVPQTCVLYPAYPNPFNPATTFSFRISHFGFTKLSIHDLLGREVSILLEAAVAPGMYTLTWNAEGQSSGVYFAVLHTQKETHTIRIMLLK